MKLENNALNNACVVFSMWGGYKKEEIYKKFLDRMKELGIDTLDLHVSGHADYTAIEAVINNTNPEYVIPIHTENKEKIKEYTDKAIILEDMEVFEV